MKNKTIFDYFARGGIIEFYKNYYESRDKLKSYNFFNSFFKEVIIYDSLHILLFPLSFMRNNIELHLHGNELIWLKLNNRNIILFRFRASLLYLCLVILNKRGKVFSVSEVVPTFYMKYFRFNFNYTKLFGNNLKINCVSRVSTKKLLLVGGNEKLKNLTWFDDNCAQQLLQLGYQITYVGFNSKHSNVISINSCPNSSLLRLMELNDVLVITSRSEGFPILIHEALGKGLRIFHKNNALLDLNQYSTPFCNLDDLVQKL